MRDPELVARAGYAAARLEQAWERWRALHGLGGSADPLASYVGYSLKEPMGQPRVVIGVDAAEAEFFADFLESQVGSAPGSGSALADAGAVPGAALAVAEAGPADGLYPQVSGPMLAQGSGAMLPPVSGPQRVLTNSAEGPSGPAVSGPLSASPALGSGPATGTGPLGPGPADATAGPGNPPGVARNGAPGAVPPSRDVPSAPMVRLIDGADPAARPAPRFEPSGPRFESAAPRFDPSAPRFEPTAPRFDPAIPRFDSAGPRFEPASPRFEPVVPLTAPVGGDRPMAASPASASAPATSAFPVIPADQPAPLGAPVASNGNNGHDGHEARMGSLPEYPGSGEPSGPPDAIAAEMAGWASGELPGQASEQLASWAAGESGGRRLRRSRSAR
jgi:hypothetical protein